MLTVYGDIQSGDPPATDTLVRAAQLAKSNAIINFLAEGTHYFPNDPWLQRVAGIPGYVSMSDAAKQLA